MVSNSELVYKTTCVKLVMSLSHLYNMIINKCIKTPDLGFSYWDEKHIKVRVVERESPWDFVHRGVGDQKCFIFCFLVSLEPGSRRIIVNPGSQISFFVFRIVNKIDSLKFLNPRLFRFFFVPPLGLDHLRPPCFPSPTLSMNPFPELSQPWVWG